MERDNRTRFGARAPGVEQQRLLERRRFSAQRPPVQNGYQMYAAGSVKDRGKPSDVQAASNGQALSDIPALKPYWGKPAVRNFREGHGNVGIIRSPLRAIALPDPSPGSTSGTQPRVCQMPDRKHQRLISAGASTPNFRHLSRSLAN